MPTTGQTGTQQPKGRIVVGVDGSGSSNGPLLWAARQAELTDASLEVVLVSHLPLMASGYTVAPPAGLDPEARAKQRLEAMIHNVLGEPDRLEVVPIVTGGPVAKTLLRIAKGADLLVVGARGHAPLVGMLVGSVSEHCVSHAKCPVVVIHHNKNAA
jgi:nucleotide-binding universal stress UspA family protein